MPGRTTPHRARNALYVVGYSLLFALPAPAADAGAYLPDRTILVVSVNVPQLLQSPPIRDGGAAVKSVVSDAAKALDGFGIDAAKDLDRIMLAVGDQLRSTSGLVLLQGRFDADKIHRRIKDQARERKGTIAVLDEGGATVFQCRLPPPNPNSRVAFPDRFFLTVLDATTIAVGIDRAAVSEALAKKAGRRTTEVKPRVIDLIGRTDPKESLSVVFVPPAELFAGGPLNGLTTVTGGMTVADGVMTDVRIDTKDAQSARLVAETIRDGLAKVRDILPGLVVTQFGLDRQDQGVIRDMADTFKATVSQDAVVITSTISRELMQKLGRKGR